MRKKSEAQLKLEQVEKLDAMIKNKLIEQQQWKEVALGITANMGGERVQSSGTKSKMADAVEKCIDIEAEINNLIDKLIDAKREAIALIEQVDSAVWYNILHMRFIQYRDLSEIAAYYGKEYDWATSTQGRALANVQKIIDKRKSL